MRVLATCLMAGALVAPAVMADVEDQIEFRQSYWQVVKHEFGDVMAAMLREKRPMDEARFAEAADRVAALAGLAKETFPAGSMSDNSRALAKIWDEPDAFAKELATFEERAGALQVAVASQDKAQIGQAVKAMGGSCKSCHDNFRAE